MSGTTVTAVPAESGVSTVSTGVTTVGASGGATITPVVCGFHPKAVIMINDDDGGSADELYVCPVGEVNFATVILATAASTTGNIVAYTSDGTDGNTLGAKGFTIPAAMQGNDDVFTWIAFR